MLPSPIAERAASLVPGERRPTLSFLVDFAQDGEPIGSRIVRGIVRSRARLDYDEADRWLAETDGRWGAVLAALDRWARARELRRIEAGAIVIRAAEVDVWVDPDGGVRLERIEPDSASRRIVGEAMVLAGELAAARCVAAGIPAIYRRQPPSDRLPALPAGAATDPVTVRRVRRALSRSDSATRPGRHHGLGIDAYVQVTSPIRRFQDLTIGRQLAAHLAGVLPPYDAEAIQRVAATTERAEIEARRAERAAVDYWLLRYLEQSVGRTVEAIVVETAPRPVVLLSETLREQPMPSLARVEPGERLLLRVERVNPRAGLLALRRVD